MSSTHFASIFQLLEFKQTRQLLGKRAKQIVLNFFNKIVLLSDFEDRLALNKMTETVRRGRDRESP